MQRPASGGVRGDFINEYIIKKNPLNPPLSKGGDLKSHKHFIIKGVEGERLKSYRFT